LLSDDKKTIIHEFECPIDISGIYNRMSISQKILKSFKDLEEANKLSNAYNSLFKDDKPGALGDHTNYEIISSPRLYDIVNAVHNA
jgi:hypothetical protein